ncbi:MAG: hypothetical protein ACO1OD_06395 [Croceibacterium sp.]
MADADLRTAEDGFEQYFAEKIWSWVPEVYRDADFTAPGGPVMRPLVEIIAGEAAVARREIDRLWENVLIDYADEWAVPYIGDLIGARPLNSINGRGVRADIGRTIGYRRRAGTLPVLDQLIQDITGWRGVVVEAWQRLGRHWHGLDDTAPAVPPRRGDTPRGGFTDLRLRRLCDGLDGPFDSFAHYPDFRKQRGLRGRYSVPKLNIHVFRRQAATIEKAMGFRLATRLFTFDPSGRECTLYANVPRLDTGGWAPPRPWHMPLPISASLLDHALFAITPATNLAGMGPRLPALVGATIEGQRQLAELARSDLGGPPSYPNAVAFRALQAATHKLECGKYQLYGTALEIASGPNIAGLVVREAERVAAAEMPPSAAAPVFPTGTDALIDPERGVVRLAADDAFRPMIWNYGCFAPVGAGGHDRAVSQDPAALVVSDTPTFLAPIVLAPTGLQGSVRFPSSQSWRVNAALPPFNRLVWKAANRIRPYVLLARGTGNAGWLAAAALDATKPADDPANRREIEIDGLWLTVEQASYPDQTLAEPAALPTPKLTTIVIDGTAAPIQRVVLRNVTLDPGGEQARVTPCTAVAIPHVRLQLRGEVQELVIENCVTGPLEEFAAPTDPCAAGRVIVRDSIVHSIDPTLPAINLKSGEVTIERSTVFGDIVANRLFATELLVTGMVTVADNQHGCFRFSAARADAGMRLPRQFESHLIADGIAPHMFVSQRFGHAGYAQLSETAPGEILTGAENGSEIGAFSRLLSPIRTADLMAKLDEYAPLNTISGFVFET